MRNKHSIDWFSFFAPRFCALSLGLSLIIRIVLAIHPLTVVDWGFLTWIKIFALGLVNDLAFTAIALVPAFVVYTFLTDDKYSKPFSYIFLGILAALTVYIVGFNDISDEYGGVVPGIANALMLLLCLSFAVKLFIPKLRRPWRIAVILLTMLTYACCAIAIAFSEVVFWSEFGVRFNFIAVDYLVYTHEVIGNIVESYPIVPMVLAMLAAGGAVCYVMLRGKRLEDFGISSWKRYALTLALLAAAVFAGIKWLHFGYRNLGSEKAFATQLQENGCWDFLEAFTSNELDYRQFYPLLPEDEAQAIQREACGQNAEGVRHIESEREPQLKNIVLITIESLSADFLARYGNTDGITPNLDKLLDKSLVFDYLFATGNRTVRGLEAVTLCIPPSSGESLVKRPDNAGLFSTASILNGLGYSCEYIYGGDSYFDNMGAFFGGNGYKVIDRKLYGKDEISFANIWGTCDEDSYKVALRTFDAHQVAGEKFFAHIMTISNHRPYTYPEGKIEYDGNPMSRSAAVKYTDYALGKFLEEAAAKPWFSETVFVILADHCASSAGKISLPLECYHIPALIYAPGFVEPAYVDKLCSQIDLMPTLLNLLGISYDSRFYGQDILSDDFRQRAFMATYQDLGYFADGILTVLSPVRKVQQFSVTETTPWNWEETPMSGSQNTVLREAEALYQTANLAYGSGK